MAYSAALLANTVIIDNQAETAGSGLYIQDSSPHVLHTTIARNKGGDGSGVHVDGTASTVALTNTILASHTVGITVTSGNMTIVNGVLWDGNNMNTAGTGTITLTNEYTGDPIFAADGYHLTFASAAIDKGLDVDVTLDVDGDHRPCGLAPDLGADEISCHFLSVILKNNS